MDQGDDGTKQETKGYWVIAAWYDLHRRWIGDLGSLYGVRVGKLLSGCVRDLIHVI